MKTRAVSAALATSWLIAMALPALAQDKTGPNVGAAVAGTAPGGVSTAGLAQDLYALGASQGDAVTVLAAAVLATSVELTAAEPAVLDPARIKFAEADQDGFRKTAAPVAAATAPAPMMDDGAPRAVAKATFFTAANADEGAAKAPVAADAMFAKARELAGEDEAIIGLIDDAMAEGSRGRVGGSVEWPSRLPSGQTDVWEIPFYGDSRAEVAVVGDGDTNLDIAVTDENGNVICYDVSWSDKLYCDWAPARDGYFYVTVQNLGAVQNSYSLLTN